MLIGRSIITLAIMSYCLLLYVAVEKYNIKKIEDYLAFIFIFVLYSRKKKREINLFT